MCAVSVPVTLNSVRESNSQKDTLSQVSATTRSDSSSGGDVKEFDLKKCDDAAIPNGSNIEFGSLNVSEVCWTLNLEIDSPAQYTDLFKEKGRDINVRWSDSNQRSDGGRTVCGSHWVISDQSSDTEYLGMCNLSTGKEGSFIKKKKESQSASLTKNLKQEQLVKLLICSKDCFNSPADDSHTSSIKQFENPREGKGQEVVFKARRS